MAAAMVWSPNTSPHMPKGGSFDFDHQKLFIADMTTANEPGNLLATRDRVIFAPGMAHDSPQSLVHLREIATITLVIILDAYALTRGLVAWATSSRMLA